MGHTIVSFHEIFYSVSENICTYRNAYSMEDIPKGYTDLDRRTNVTYVAIFEQG
jgi:hypothetical protein